MTDAQWEALFQVVSGEPQVSPLVGLLVDCPWLPGWAGAPLLDYLTDDHVWLEVNLRAVNTFPDVLFLPGFWAEFGMCTEPSAFGGKCIWPENEFPFAGRVLYDYAEVKRLQKPNCRTDGLCPWIIRRLQRCQAAIERAGHRIRFAASRGPLNIATYLLGHTETFIGMKTNPAEIHRLLATVTEFVVDWVRYQAACFPSIEGLLVLDDLIGFLGEADFDEFVVPYFRQIAAASEARIKLLHNDCYGLITARRLAAMGFNMFNFSFEHKLSEVRKAAGPEITLLGNVPPRDVLARGTAEDVRRSVATALADLADRRRLVLSAGGGTPPGVSSENIRALCQAARA